jgi:hypothetical protein
MPYKDPEKRREAVRRWRIRNGLALDRLADDTTASNPPSRDYLLWALGIQARQGNVVACRILLEEYRHDEADELKRQERGDGVARETQESTHDPAASDFLARRAQRSSEVEP